MSVFENYSTLITVLKKQTTITNIYRLTVLISHKIRDTIKSSKNSLTP